MVKPNSALQKFHQIHCNDLPIESLQVFYKLLNEIRKTKEEKKEKTKA